MNTGVWLRLAASAGELDRQGLFHEADEVTRLLGRMAQSYNPKYVNLPIDSRMWPYKADEPELQEKEYDYFNQPRFRQPGYIDLPGGEDTPQEASESIFDMHGTGDITGPAYVDQGNTASSPSMAGDVNQFTWKNTHEQNDNASDRWKNVQPRR